MFHNLLFNSARGLGILLAAATCLLSPGTGGDAQQPASAALHFKVERRIERLEMTVNYSRILTMDGSIPRAQVANPSIVKLTPLSRNQIQIAALKAGVTQVNLWDENDKIYTVDVVVYGDARELQLLLESEFPGSSLRVRPLSSSVVISGFVNSPEIVSRVVAMAQDYYPKVINNITVGGVQQIKLHCKVMEVSRTKLEAMGFDWAHVSGSDFVVSSVSGLISAAAAQTGTAVGTGGDTVRFGIVDGNESFFGFLELLRQNNLAKVLAEPTIVAVSGRPSTFSVGGEFPVPVPAGLGTLSIEYREFGTRLDFVPVVLGNGKIRLEVRPSVSEIDPTRSVTIDSITIPGLRTRMVDTAVEMKAGQTLALAGLIQTRVETENKAVPWVGDMPWIGAAFRRTETTVNEIELLIVVTPELVGALDPHEVPPGGPGSYTAVPTKEERFIHGYTEVPRIGPQHYAPVISDQHGPGASHPSGGEAVPAPGRQPDGQPEAGSGRSPTSGGRDADPAPAPTSLDLGARGRYDYFRGDTRPLRARRRPPAAADGSRPYNRYTSHSHSANPQRGPAAPASSSPGLIGPVGYDVLD